MSFQIFGPTTQQGRCTSPGGRVAGDYPSFESCGKHHRSPLSLGQKPSHEGIGTACVRVGTSKNARMQEWRAGTWAGFQLRSKLHSTSYFVPVGLGGYSQSRALYYISWHIPRVGAPGSQNAWEPRQSRETSRSKPPKSDRPAGRSSWNPGLGSQCQE